MRSAIHIYRSARTTRKTAPRNRFASSVALFAAAALLLACGDGSGGTGPDTRVASVTVSPAARALVVGAVTTLEATPKNGAGEPLAGRDIEWTTSDPLVAEVSATGAVEAIGVGRATITAMSEGRRGTARIDVAALPPVPVASVRVEQRVLALPKYEARQLAAQALDADGNVLEGRTIEWTSHDPAVAPVDGGGRITGKSEGDTRIVVSSEGRSTVVEVTVLRAPVSRVILAPASPELDRGESQRIAIRLEDEQGVELADRWVTWTSSESRAIHVTSQGVAFGLAEGTSTITAESEGRSAQVELRVVAPPAFDLLFDRRAAVGRAEIFRLAFDAPSLPMRLNAGDVSSDPSPSPDGLRVVFTVSQTDLTTGRPQNDLYIVNVDGMAMRRLTSLPGIEREPAWSPDGTRIAFSAIDEQGRTDIWLVNADGGGLVNLTAAMGEWTAEHTPAWSPDGRRIAFATTWGGIASAIWTMRPDGSDRQQLATDVGHGMHPAWSPDGTQIAFDYFAGPTTGSDIAIVPAAGGATTKLAQPGNQLAPAWSPDGALIAYMGTGAAQVYQIWTMRPDGSGARMRTGGTTLTGGMNPSWIVRR